MALGTIPSWLDLPNFIQAMREGAQTGLAARQQDASESQAADRLQLAYDSLAEKERVAGELAQAKQQAASDALDLRQQQADTLNNYRQAQIQQMQDKANKTSIHFGPNGEVLSYDPAGGTVNVLRQADQKSSPDSVTETYKIPAVDAVEGKPAYGGWPVTGWFAHPAVPAVPGQPERTIRKTIKGSAADALSQDDGDATTLTYPQEGTDGFVTVTNPSGKKVRIKQSQLQDALSQGYSQ